jgi:hypothetical protein
MDGIWQASGPFLSRHKNKHFLTRAFDFSAALLKSITKTRSIKISHQNCSTLLSPKKKERKIFIKAHTKN